MLISLRTYAVNRIGDQHATMREPGGKEHFVAIRRMQAAIYFVDDWVAAMTFYRDVLGLQESVNFPNRWALFRIPGGGSITLQPRL